MYRKVYKTRNSNVKEKVKYITWTSDMDRCLAKILVEQVEKGNKIDNMLKPEAYLAAVSALNENFSLDLTKEHIKSRLKTWKKQYGVLKELLAQKGFEWDEVRRMVVADDHVWKDYIKVHPDARTFRAKLVDNYDDLCIILGNDRAIGSSADNDVEGYVDLTTDKEDLETVIMSEIRNDEKQTKNLRWTEEMDRCLGKILVDQVKMGYKIDNILQREAYNTAVTVLSENFGPYLTKDHIRNRLRTWKKQYGILKELLSHTGFGWDEKRKMIIANDSVWNDYIKTHPDARVLRGRAIKNHNDLWIIFGDGQLFESCSRNSDAFLSLSPDNDIIEATDTSHRSLSTKEQSKYVIWTKEMDSCLGKVLVEQAKLGNKIDNNLKSAAYTVSVTAINKRFRLDLMKDHIRNRLKTWKKRYVILNELLEQSGFQWDENRNMVVADDSAWEDYIKSHPDARFFRARTFENYNQMCIIFGNNNAVESYSRNGDDILYLATNFEGMETLDASPIRCGGIMEEQVNNIQWTNQMDQCLSKILVEQIKLGNKNRLDNKLKPTAYAVAISALNENFQLDLTKDHIKNRLRTWKKLHGVMKELLCQSNFEWDKTKKMVIANDSLWNDYIKINPDARLLLGRVIENYDELCIIMGNDDPTESCSLSVAEIDLDLTADNDGLDTEDPFHRIEPARGKGKYIIWSDEMDRCLTENLVEQVKLGNKLEKNLRPAAYTAALTALNEKFGLDLTKENIRSRLKTWKKQYGLVTDILSHRGFEWDDRRKMVVAHDSVWNEYIKGHPDARLLRAKCIENYDELRIIISNDLATGHCSREGAKVDMSPTSNDEEHVETPAQLMLEDEEMSHDNTCNGMQGSSQQTRTRPSSSSHSKQPSKKRRTSDVMIEMMRAMATNIGRIADALRESNNTVCLDELFEMVQNIPGFDDDLIIEACEYLSFDEKRAKMFMKLDQRLRKLWLLKRLRVQHSLS